jgi:membrane protein
MTSPMALFWKRFWRALLASYDDGALGFAKGAAYSALLAFFPVLTVVTAILVQSNAAAVSRSIAEFLFQVAPPGSEELIRYAVTQQGARPATLPLVAAILALWAASGVMMSLMEGFQAAYRKPDTRGLIKKRLIAMGLVFFGILPIVGATTLMLFGDRAERAILTWLGFMQAGDAFVGGVKVVGHLLRYTIVTGATVLVTALLYAFGPQMRIKTRQIWPGAFLATMLWFIVTLGFAWYVRNIANYNVLYGSIGAVIALLVWMYLLAFIALVGCEYNAEVGGR